MGAFPAGSAPVEREQRVALFFDADWFDVRLAERGVTRAALAEAAGLASLDLDRVYRNARAPSAQELSAFAGVLGVDLVEVSLRAGVSSREAVDPASPSARIESIEARLDALDDWIAELEKTRKRA
jgi:transcriptional regulator with XRE-family HTH domain